LSLSLNIVNPIEIEEWDGWMVSNPQATIFHSANWAKVLFETYGFRPMYFCSGQPAAPAVVLPFMEVSSRITGTRGVSLPFSDQCPLLMPQGTDSREIREEILNYARKAGWLFAEFRDDTMFDGSEPAACRFYSHEIELGIDFSEYLKSIKHATRSSLKKAQKEGVKVAVSTSPDAMETFYKLNCLTRKRHGLPPQPIEFFRKIQEHVVSNGLGVIMTAALQSHPAAAAICLHFGGNAIMKYAAHDLAYQSVRPSNLLVWEAIEWHSRAGMKVLSFGRSDMNNNGLRRFKLGWNLTERVLQYYKFDFRANRVVADPHPILDWSPKVLAMMPVSVLKVLGRLLYKHMG